MEALDKLQTALGGVQAAYNELGHASPGVTTKLAEIMVLLRRAVAELQGNRNPDQTMVLEVPGFLRRR